MPYQAQFAKGSPHMVDYKPVGAVAAGDVIVQGDLVAIAHLDIPAGKQGALAVGGGVYLVTTDAGIAAGTKLYWDDAANKVSSVATGKKQFGFLLDLSSADGDVRRALHHPG